MAQVIGGAMLKDPAAVKSLQELKLTVADLQKLSPDERFKRIAEALMEIQDPAVRANKAMDMFGRTGNQLMPVLAGLAESSAKMKKYGLGMSADEAEKAHEVEKSWGFMKAAANRLSDAVGVALAPAMLSLADRFGEVAKSAKEWLQTHAELIVKIPLAIGLVGALGVAFWALGAAITYASTPSTLIVAALGGIGYMALSATGGIDTLTSSFDSLAVALSAGNIAAALGILKETFNVTWLGIKLEAMKVWYSIGEGIYRIWELAGRGINTVWEWVVKEAKIGWAGTVAAGKLGWASMIESFKLGWAGVKAALDMGVAWLAKKLQKLVLTVADALRTASYFFPIPEANYTKLEAFGATLGKMHNDWTKSGNAALLDMLKAEKEYAVKKLKIAVDLIKATAAAKKAYTEGTTYDDAEYNAMLAKDNDELGKIAVKLNAAKEALAAYQKQAGEDRGFVGPPPYYEDEPPLPDEQQAAKWSTVGTMSGAALWGLGTGATERMVRGIEAIVTNTKKIADNRPAFA
jgi:hypothetical protein